MKVCPTCNEVYKDDDINFCLSDGTTLRKKRGGATAAKLSHWNSVFALILVGLAVLIAISLVNGSWDDRLFGSVEILRLPGAFFKGVLGWSAYSIPILIGLIAWRFFQSDTLVPRASRVAGYVLFAVSLSGLVSLFGGYGATVGEAAALWTAYFIGSIGAEILLAAIFIGSLILITNLTLDSFVNAFGLAGENFLMRWNEWLDKRRESRSDEIAGANVISSELISFQIREAERMKIEEERHRKKEEFLAIRGKVIKLKNLVLEKVEAGRSGEIAYLDFDSMDGLEFEHFVAKLMSHRGFSADVTKGSGDLGVDILANNHEGLFAVQVKRYNHPVSRRAVSDAVAGRDHYGCNFAMVVTNNYFTDDAKKLASSNSCVLIDRDELKKWISEWSGGDYDFDKSLYIEIERLQDAGYLWGEDIIKIVSRELRGDISLSYDRKQVAVVSPLSAFYEHDGLPSPNLLRESIPPLNYSEPHLRSRAADVATAMNEERVYGKVFHISPGPVITSFLYSLDKEIDTVDVTSISKAVRRKLGLKGIRVVKGHKTTFSIDILNEESRPTLFRELVESRAFTESPSKGTIALGKTTEGRVFVQDIFRSPNIFVAGATNRRRTAGIDNLLCSLLFKAGADELKLVLVDSDRQEFSIYADLPHLATAIISDPLRGKAALKWIENELSSRRVNLDSFGVRNIDEYNEEVTIRVFSGVVDEKLSQFPHILVVVNELSDLLVGGDDLFRSSLKILLENSTRLGVHFVLAAQRVDGEMGKFINSVSGIMKLVSYVPAPFDARYLVDSNVIDQFLAPDEMFLFTGNKNQVVRLNESQLLLEEISRIVEFCKQNGRLEHDTTITKTEEELDDSGDLPGRRDPLFMDALRCVVQAKRGDRLRPRRRHPRRHGPRRLHRRNGRQFTCPACSAKGV